MKNEELFTETIESYVNGQMKQFKSQVRRYGLKVFIVEVLDDENIIQTSAGFDKADIIKQALDN